MARNKKQALEEVHNIISKGTTIQGDISSPGILRVEGKIIGNIKSASRLIIDENGSVEGTIKVKFALISGKVKGTIATSQMLHIQQKGRIEGDIFTKKLAIDIGGSFTGNCQMGDELNVDTLDVQKHERGKTEGPEAKPQVEKKPLISISKPKSDDKLDSKAS